MGFYTVHRQPSLHHLFVCDYLWTTCASCRLIRSAHFLSNHCSRLLLFWLGHRLLLILCPPLQSTNIMEVIICSLQEMEVDDARHRHLILDAIRNLHTQHQISVASERHLQLHTENTSFAASSHGCINAAEQAAAPAAQNLVTNLSVAASAEHTCISTISCSTVSTRQPVEAPSSTSNAVRQGSGRTGAPPPRRQPLAATSNMFLPMAALASNVCDKDCTKITSFFHSKTSSKEQQSGNLNPVQQQHASNQPRDGQQQQQQYMAAPGMQPGPGGASSFPYFSNPHAHSGSHHQAQQPHHNAAWGGCPSIMHCNQQPQQQQRPSCQQQQAQQQLSGPLPR